MPAFYLKCGKCQKDKRKILAKYVVTKCECGGDLVRTNQGKQSTMIKETLDNGAMTRKIERIHNVQELMKERSKEPGPDDFI